MNNRGLFSPDEDLIGSYFYELKLEKLDQQQAKTEKITEKLTLSNQLFTESLFFLLGPPSDQ